jgi:hypothetical protein
LQKYVFSYVHKTTSKKPRGFAHADIFQHIDQVERRRITGPTTDPIASPSDDTAPQLCRVAEARAKSQKVYALTGEFWLRQSYRRRTVTPQSFDCNVAITSSAIISATRKIDLFFCLNSFK